MILHDNGNCVIVFIICFSFGYHYFLDEGLCKRGQLSKDGRAKLIQNPINVTIFVS